MREPLAVKYRPKTFDDVTEQGSIKTILINQLETKTTKNCYLFTGGAGTGKTTTARIFANEINGGKGEPIEIDGASNNGVDNVREIIENAKMKSLDSPYKVYIIDECHMLTTGAWNAMLKLIEEPPKQTVFIFCTTDPQKIPATILSRVQRYDFRRLSYSAIVDRLKYIIESELSEQLEEKPKGRGKKKVDKEKSNGYELSAIEYIAKMADGGMRDAITLLDKCVSHSDKLTLESVIDALGTVDYSVMLALSDAIFDCDRQAVIKLTEEIHRGGADLKQFIKQFGLFVLDMTKFKITGSFEYLNIPQTLNDELLSRVKIEGYYDFWSKNLKLILDLDQKSKWETNPKYLIQAVLIGLAQFDEEA